MAEPISSALPSCRKCVPGTPPRRARPANGTSRGQGPEAAEHLDDLVGEVLPLQRDRNRFHVHDAGDLVAVPVAPVQSQCAAPVVQDEGDPLSETNSPVMDRNRCISACSRRVSRALLVEVTRRYRRPLSGDTSSMINDPRDLAACRSIQPARRPAGPASDDRQGVILQRHRRHRRDGRGEQPGEGMVGPGLDGAGDAEFTHQPGCVVPLDRVSHRLGQIHPDGRG